MSHSVNPKLFRIKRTKDWDSKGFYEDNFSAYLEEDFEIRKFLKKEIGEFGVARIEIKRSPNKIDITIFSMRPGLIIGRGGEKIKELRQELKKIMSKSSFRDARKDKEFKLRLEVKEVRDSWANASLVAQWMAQETEKRTHYRRILKKALSKIMNQKNVKGAKVQIAGRLNGISIARTEWLREGLLPRQTIRADIDFAKETAVCSYGAVGIKVWIYKKEDKLEKKEEK
jgi:small subunit ribosomal protein S3